jgi:DNA phosphorothioation-associated putative methyltransferase
MLLTVIDLIESSDIPDGWVRFDVRLVSRFRDYWELVLERQRNQPDISMPFHGRGGDRDRIWHRFTTPLSNSPLRPELFRNRKIEFGSEIFKQHSVLSGFMDGKSFHEQVEAISIGKRLPGAIYLLDDPETPLPLDLRVVCTALRERLELDASFNLLKFHRDAPKISFLSYPTFFKEAHPPLMAGVIVDLVTGKVRRDDYSGRANPPILHRKETMLPPGHPKHPLFARLSAAEEEAGLLDQPSQIGFRENWQRRLSERGFAIRGHRLERNEEAPPTISPPAEPPPVIRRERTAIVRGEASKPLKLILENNLLSKGEAFFDYGCGHGDDIAVLEKLGHRAAGWDPHHRPEAERAPAEIVNLGFVLNVIEDPAERVETLLKAWALARARLVVSTLVAGCEAYQTVEACGDGIVTSRATFQKYFAQEELRALIEDTLQTECVPLALGVFVAFREFGEMQDFLARRSRRRLDWELLSARLGIRQALRARRDPYLLHRELLDDFWNATLALGRAPRDEEYAHLAEVRAACGSVPKAFRLFFERFGEAVFAEARARRREDLLVFLTAGLLRREAVFSRFSKTLQRDILSLFGNHKQALEEARHSMFAAGDDDEIQLALSQIDFGWHDEAEGHLTFHRSLLDELPLVFRLFVECGARLFGDPRQADLIKIHYRSKKLTFQQYDDFEGKALPELRLRIKIDLRRLFVSVFDHTQGPDRQSLFFKERFVRPDFPFRNDAAGFSKRLRKLGFTEATIGHGPSLAAFEAFRKSHGLTPSLRPPRPSQTGKSV